MQTNRWVYPVLVFTTVFLLASCKLLLEETAKANHYQAHYEASRADNEAFRRTVGRQVNNGFICKVRRSPAIIEEEKAK